MKVAVLVEHFPPKMGSDRRIYELMKRLTARHDVNFIVIPSFRGLCGMIRKESHDVASNSEDSYVHESIVAHPVRIPETLRRLWQKSFKLAYVLSMILLIPIVTRKLRRINPTVIVLNYPSVYTGILGFLAAKILRKKCVVDFNDLIAQYTVNLLDLKKSDVASRILIMVQNFIVKKSDGVVVPTDFIRKYTLALKVKRKRICVIPNGVDTQLFCFKEKSYYRTKLNTVDKNVCVYFGRLEKWAGTSILNEVSNIFGQKRPHVRFVIVGGGSAETTFSHNMVVVKEVPHEKVPEIIALADVVLVPFPNNEVSHAASPLKLFEAMAMGKPVVASAVSGIQDVVEDGYNGLLVSSDKPEEWAQAVETILDSKKLQIKLSKNAQESAKSYDWSVLACQLESVLLNSNRANK